MKGKSAFQELERTPIHRNTFSVSIKTIVTGLFMSSSVIWKEVYEEEVRCKKAQMNRVREFVTTETFGGVLIQKDIIQAIEKNRKTILAMTKNFALDSRRKCRESRRHVWHMHMAGATGEELT